MISVKERWIRDPSCPSIVQECRDRIAVVPEPQPFRVLEYGGYLGTDAMVPSSVVLSFPETVLDILRLQTQSGSGLAFRSWRFVGTVMHGTATHVNILRPPRFGQTLLLVLCYEALFLIRVLLSLQ